MVGAYQQSDYVGNHQADEGYSPGKRDGYRGRERADYYQGQLRALDVDLRVVTVSSSSDMMLKSLTYKGATNAHDTKTGVEESAGVHS